MNNFNNNLNSIFYQYRNPIGKVITKYNGFWCDKIRSAQTKNESLERINNTIKNNSETSNVNRSIKTTLEFNKSSSFYSTNGFKNSSVHQIQQNGRLPSVPYSNGVGLNLDHTMPQNYTLSTLAHPLRVCPKH